MRLRWLAELLLGAKLAIAGGRDGWVRTGLTTIGVGLGVALLLAAASLPTVLTARDARAEARYPAWPGPEAVLEPAEDTLLATYWELEFRDERIWGVVLQPEGPAAPVPPGLTALPGPGELVVSPALAELLASPDGPLLAPRLDYPIVGQIGDEGLRGPYELMFYLGSDQLDPEPTSRIDHFGVPSGSGEGLPVLLILLGVVGLVVLLLPVATFITVASRFGGEQTDRRLAAIRLVGADQGMVRRIAAGEVLLGTVAGMLMGGLLFLVGRALVESVPAIDVFTADVRPHPGLVGLTVVATPVLTLTVTLFALRRLVAEPLGVTRRAGGGRRRLWWRPLPTLAGLALLAPLLVQSELTGRAWEIYQIAGGVLLLLVGVLALLPWLIEATVRRLRGGPVAWQLATRRLQLAGGTAARVVSGVAVAAAGGIALQMLFVSVESDYVHYTDADPGRLRAGATIGPPDGESTSASITPAEIEDRFTATTGVREVTVLPVQHLAPEADEMGDGQSLVVGDCPTLQRVAQIDQCRDGDVFLIPYEFGSLPEPGQTLRAAPRTGTPTGEEAEWTVPTDARTVVQQPGSVYAGIAATPGAVAGFPYQPDLILVNLELDPAVPDVAEHVRNTAAGINPWAFVSVDRPWVSDGQFEGIRRGLVVGIAATLVLIGLSLLVGTLEQLRERRRPLAVLAAFGVRRGVLGWSVLWQTALLVGLGLGLATVSGLGVGTALLRIAHRPITVDWPSLFTISGIGAAVVLLVTLLSLPALWQLMRPEGLRTE